MRRRIKRLETALGADVSTPEHDLDELMPPQFCENLHKVYGQPGEEVYYNVTRRDMFVSMVRVYGRECLPDIERDHGAAERARIEAEALGGEADGTAGA